ncbi:MAG: hypothetical protein WBA57_14175 [Elainellaceae cyanobacterium]
MVWPFSGRSWRDLDGEDDMTEEDWAKRGQEQAMAMLHAGTPEHSSPDEDGDPTFGCYNGDYPDSWHNELNRRLDDDGTYAEKTEADVRSLLRADTERRADQDTR